MIWPQTSLAYLAAVAEKEGLTVDIVDCIAEEIGWNEYRRLLGVLKPSFIVGNVISVTFGNDVSALRAAKDLSGAITIGMGPHLTNEPARSLREINGLDFIICHEAEGTLAELLALYRKNPEPSVARLSGIRGIAFIPGRIGLRAEDDVVITEQRPFIQDLDTLPRPRHDLLALDRYWAPFLGNYTFVEAARGCAYRCVFCRQAVMWQWKVRSRNGQKLAEEALYVHSLGVDNILFHADTFTLDTRMVEELCDSLIEKGSPFRWACNSHVKPLLKHPELLQRMKRAGCWMIAVGIESADNQVLKNIKKQITAEEAKTVISMIDSAGIEAWGYFVLGLPGDTRQTMRKTVRFAMKLPLKMAKFDIGAPYPGTEFYDYCRRNDYLRVNQYEQFDQNASAVVEYPHLSRREIKRTVWLANLLFLLQPRILRRIFSEMRDFRYLESVIRIVNDQTRLMSDGTLSRRFMKLFSGQREVS